MYDTLRYTLVVNFSYTPWWYTLRYTLVVNLPYMPPGTPFVGGETSLYASHHPFHCWACLVASPPPVSLLGMPSSLPFFTRFTVGMPPSLPSSPVSLLGNALASFLYPFHCWARKGRVMPVLYSPGRLEGRFLSLFYTHQRG